MEPTLTFIQQDLSQIQYVSVANDAAVVFYTDIKAKKCLIWLLTTKNRTHLLLIIINMDVILEKEYSISQLIM